MNSMINVVAAHSLRQGSALRNRSIATHFKGYGSGRIALSKIDDEDSADSTIYFNEENKFCKVVKANKVSFFKSYQPYLFEILKKLTLKLWLLLLAIFTELFPFFLKPIQNPKNSLKAKAILTKSTNFEKLNDKLVLSIIQYCDVKTIIRLEATCRRFRKIVYKNLNNLPKILTDQVKLYFDEGEVIIYPIDERFVPARYVMPSIENLENQLKHLTTLSLFIRGLIAIETIPILKRLSRLYLSPIQIYFLWCDFDPKSEDNLISFLNFNSKCLTDIGFEVCTPISIISDKLFCYNLSHLTSLRIWNSDKTGEKSAISDKLLMELANIYTLGISGLETIDLASVRCTIKGVIELIQSWYHSSPNNNLSIGLHNFSGRLNRNEIIARCNLLDIPLDVRGLQSNGYFLTIYIT